MYIFTLDIPASIVVDSIVIGCLVLYIVFPNLNDIQVYLLYWKQKHEEALQGTEYTKELTILVLSKCFFFLIYFFLNLIRQCKIVSKCL